jgi:chromosome segregation ATPase
LFLGKIESRNGAMMIRHVGIAVFLFFVLSISEVDAQYRHHYRSSSYHRNAAAMAQAQKRQLVSTLQMQLATANQLLANAESRSSISQSSAYDAMNKLNMIRKEMESASAEAHDAFKELQMVEADIMESQSDHSEFAEATKKVNEAKSNLHQVFHELAKTPVENRESTDNSLFLEMSRLPESQQTELKNNDSFRFAKEQLADAEQKVIDIRKKLFDGSKEWRNAKRTLDSARAESHSEAAKAKTATVTAKHQSQESNQLKNVVENAKLVIAQCETRLRQLGVKPTSPNYGKR